MDEEIAAIRDGLDTLRKLRRPIEVFGSETHGFRVHPTLAESEVLEFEARHGITLPLEYRKFLIQVGNGGAGPEYGIFKLGEMDDGYGHRAWAENDWFVGVLSQPFPHVEPWNDLAGRPEYDATRNETNPDYEDEYHRQLEAWENRVYWNPAVVNGAIPISHIGCALRRWLVVTGPERGNIWDDDRADCEGLSPLYGAGFERVNFIQWYKYWLDQVLRLAGKSHGFGTA